MMFHRFSRDGFTPKQQTYHLRILNSYLQPLDLTKLNDYQKRLQLEAYEKAQTLLQNLNFKDWQEGVFAFIYSLPDPDWIRHELNHLNYTELNARSWFQENLPETIEIYSTYGLIPTLYTATDFLKKFGIGSACYIPKRSLKE